jgi:hypothetical protein
MGGHCRYKTQQQSAKCALCGVSRADKEAQVSQAKTMKAGHKPALQADEVCSVAHLLGARSHFASG